MLTKCRECDAEVSDSAKKCPQCGVDTPDVGQATIRAAFYTLGFGVLAGLLGSIAFTTKSQETRWLFGVVTAFMALGCLAFINEWRQNYRKWVS